MGHEIAAHGFRHRSYNSMTREEIEKDLLSCKDAFDQIGITVKGFRPPFLSYKEEMYSVAMDLGYTYVSGSVSYNFPLYKNFAASDEPTPKAHGRLIELPITTLSDFDLISYEGKSIMEAVDHWKMSVGEQSTLLFHPFLAGAKENLPPLEDFFRFIKGEFEVATACEKAEGKKGVSLTMDVGVLTKWDLIRALF